MRAMVVCVWMAAASVVLGGQPAPLNPYRGAQPRQEVFEFAEKPSVKREGAKWVIAFASKGRCDATVAILDKQGKIVRHLASGVLGPNAPWPFQQDSLVQRIEGDGLSDSFEKAPEGCRVRVSLGLKAKYELSMACDPYDLPQRGKNAQEDPTYVGSDAQGNVYVGAVNRGACQGYVFDRQGKYLRTFCPIPAAEVETSGLELATTEWGEKTISAWRAFARAMTSRPLTPSVTRCGTSSAIASSVWTSTRWPSSCARSTSGLNRSNPASPSRSSTTTSNAATA